MSFSNRLNKILKHTGLTKKDFVEKCKTNTTRLFYYLKDQQKPNTEFYQNLSKAFPEVNIHWLIAGEGAMILGEKEQSSANAKSPSLYNKEEIKNLDVDCLETIIVMLELALNADNSTMDPDKKAQLIIALYSIYAKVQTKPSKEEVLTLIRLAS